MNFFDKVAEAAKKVSELGVPSEERIPNRQEVRFYRAQENRYNRKISHLNWRIKQLIERPTAYLMPKHPYLYPNYFPFPGSEPAGAQVATATTID